MTVLREQYGVYLTLGNSSSGLTVAGTSHRITNSAFFKFSFLQACSKYVAPLRRGSLPTMRTLKVSSFFRNSPGEPISERSTPNGTLTIFDGGNPSAAKLRSE